MLLHICAGGMKQSGLLGWLKRKTLPRSRRPWLPDPNRSDVTNALAFIATNDADVGQGRDDLRAKARFLPCI